MNGHVAWPGLIPEVNEVSTDHAAQTELIWQKAEGRRLIPGEAFVSVGVHGVATVGTRIVFKTNAEFELVAMPWFDPESGPILIETRG
jgi:hypothetical protein